MICIPTRIILKTVDLLSENISIAGCEAMNASRHTTEKHAAEKHAAHSWCLQRQSVLTEEAINCRIDLQQMFARVLGNEAKEYNRECWFVCFHPF